MANELSVAYPGSLSTYAILRRKSDSTVFNGTSFVTWNISDIGSYDIPLTDVGGDSSVADMPSGIGSGFTYVAYYYEQAGASPSDDDDLLLDVDEFYWSGGTATSTPSSADWKTILTIIVRNLIGDTSASPTYTDARIQQAIVVAGIIVSQEYGFTTDYTFDLQSPEITPDPTVAATYDPIAMALFSLKAACMLSLNSFQAAVGAGIRVRDGSSEVDTTAGFGGYKSIMEMGPCSAYKTLLQTNLLNRGMLSGRGILTPVGGYAGGRSIFGNTRYFFDEFAW